LTERERPRTWDDVERIAGIKRTVPPRPTLRDVDKLTAMHLRGWPAWRRKFRGLR
jgi:hypothetical protein